MVIKSDSIASPFPTVDPWIYKINSWSEKSMVGGWTFHPTFPTHETSIPLYLFKASTVMTLSSHCAILSKIKPPQSTTGFFPQGFFIVDSVLRIFPCGFSPLPILVPHPLYKLLSLRLKYSPKILYSWPIFMLPVTKRIAAVLECSWYPTITLLLDQCTHVHKTTDGPC